MPAASSITMSWSTVGWSIPTSAGLEPNGSSAAGLGLLNGDGKSGFLIRNTGTVAPGALDIGEVVNGAAVFTPIGGVGLEWQFKGIGDFLGDGHTGFLIRNNGSVAPGVLDVGEVVNGNLTFAQIGTA